MLIKFIEMIVKLIMRRHVNSLLLQTVSNFPRITIDRIYPMMKSFYLRQMRSLVLIIILLGATATLFGQGINPGTIGDPQTICYGSAPRKALSFNPLPSGGTGPYSYQWQRSDNSVDGPWENLSGSTRNTYSPPVLGKNTWFRCMVKDALNVEGATNVIMITVLSNLNAGQIGASQTICSGSVPDALVEVTAATGGGGSGYSYQWQSSPNGTSWTNIQGETGTSFTPPALTARTYYKRLVIDAACGTKGSNYALITVQQPAAQMYIDRNAIGYGASANLSVIIEGGTPPYIINYSVNGEVQEPIENYASGSGFSTGFLTTGEYEYALISVSDAGGCNASTNGSPVTLEVNNEWTYDFTYIDRSSMVADGWDFIAQTQDGSERNTEMTNGAVVSFDQQSHPGVINIPVDEGDLWEGMNSTRNTLFRDLPPDWTSIRLKIASFNPTKNYQQAGLALYQDDDNYACLTRVHEGQNRITFISESDRDGENISSSLSDITEDIYFRIDWDSRTGVVVAFHSTDGLLWETVGTVTQWFSNPRLAIVVSGDEVAGDYPVASIARAEVSTEPLPPITDYLWTQTGELVFNTVEGQSAEGSRSILITSQYGTLLQWNATVSDDWIVPEATNGDVDGVLSVGVNSGTLISGVYNGVITLTSPQAPDSQIEIQVVLIVNPDVPVKATIWRDGRSAAMSVSVDDGSPTAFDELVSIGFKGTYLCNGTVPPTSYTDFYNAGMELGSHLVNHHCNLLKDNILRSIEIVPSIAGIAANTPQSADDLITLAWTCGVANYQMQVVAADYFLAARGYNINQLEDATPENFMNLKSFNTRGFEPVPPVDLKLVVDQAVLQNKWFNLVLHSEIDEDGAINYAGTQDVWGASIGSVVKYIMQRDRLILSNYTATNDVISFSATRLPVPASGIRSFETAIGINDSITIQVNIDGDRDIENVSVNGNLHKYTTKEIDGISVLFINLLIDASNTTEVEITYYNESTPRIFLNTKRLNFVAAEDINPLAQSFTISSLSQDVTWNISFDGTQPEWISTDKLSGTGNGSVEVNINSDGLVVGIYSTDIIVSSPEAYNSPQIVSVKLRVNPEGIFHYDFIYPDRTSLIEDGWSFIARTSSGAQRDTEVTSGLVVSYDQESHPGVLRIPVGQGDLWESANNTSNSLFRVLPSGWTSIRLKVAGFNPSQNYQQVSLVLYQDDDNYLQVTRIYQGENQVSFSQETNGIGVTISSFAVSAISDLYFRLDWYSQLETVIAYYSLNGSDWIYAGNIVRSALSNPRLAIITGASPSGVLNADIEWAQISIRSLEPLVDELHAYPSSLVFNITQGQESSISQSIFLYTELDRNIELTPSHNISWLSVSAQDVETEGSIIVNLSGTSGLSDGVHTGFITISATPDPWSDPIEIPVSLIVNPDVGVRTTNWKDGLAGVMSVTVDDGYDSAFDLLNENGFQGTYVYNGTTPPAFYADYHYAGMELGSHLNTHPYGIVQDDLLRHIEIEPNINGLYANIPTVSAGEIITLVWPNAISSERMQAIASEYFLSARGDDSNQLEDVTPEDFMNLKFFAHEYNSETPDLKSLVDAAIAERKWFIMCLHSWTEGLDDGAIEYAVGKDIWVTSVGNVIKYILQRDRFVLTGFSSEENMITFNASRLAVPSSIYRSFETAFNINDSTTLQIDIDDSRVVESVTVNGSSNKFLVKNIEGNTILLTNVLLAPAVNNVVEVNYEAIENKSVTTLLGEELSSVSASLSQNSPNPFSSNTWIEFFLPEESKVLLEVYNSSGYKVETIINQSLPEGNYKILWETGNQPSGIYFMKLITPTSVDSKRMIIFK